MKELEKYLPKKSFLLCVDSDGCVIDGMTVKHLECFGPALVENWRLEEFRQDILEYWNELNLYSMKRGINRFLGLRQALCHFAEKGYVRIETGPLEEWVDHSPELSNSALEREIRSNPADILKQAYDWSVLVNQKIRGLPDERKRAFPGVKEALARIHIYADICIVSSANREAVLEEWEKNGLLEYTDVILTQEYGGKRDCIQRCMERGFRGDQVLMVGDAPGDLKAAKEAGALFYGIQVQNEAASWNRLQHEILELFLNKTYEDKCMQEQEQAFLQNLGGAE